MGVNTAWELSRAEDDARKFPNRASPFSPPTPKAVSCLCTESLKTKQIRSYDVGSNYTSGQIQMNTKGKRGTFNKGYSLLFGLTC